MPKIEKHHYTVGAIQRLGLLKNRAGKAYYSKSAIIKIVLTLKHTKIQTPWGEGYSVPQGEIERFNKLTIKHETRQHSDN